MAEHRGERLVRESAPSQKIEKGLEMSVSGCGEFFDALDKASKKVTR